jgi:phosphopantetheinyl transferase
MIKVRVMKFSEECETGFDTHCLCATDRKKLSEMRSAVSRERFLFTQRILYRVLSEETGLDQSALSIGMGQYGKPYLENLQKFVDFSLSHCREFLAIATSFDEHVGIDIEDRPLRGQAPEFAAVCSIDELRWLSTLPEVDFLELWTKKEAFLKLNGVGLSIDPKEVEVAQERLVLYSGVESLLYSHAEVLMHKSDQRYVLSVAYPSSEATEVAIEFIDEDCLLES